MELSTLINKTDYIILELMIKNESYSSYVSLSTPYLIKKSKLSHVKVRQVLKNFILLGFVHEGSKDGNKKTYYITESGLEHYKDIFGLDDKDIEKMIEDYIEEEKNNNDIENENIKEDEQ